MELFKSNSSRDTYRKQALGVMVFNATFPNILVISWRSVLLVEETGIPGENYRPVAPWICPWGINSETY
jgi:hypothetical protein